MAPSSTNDADRPEPPAADRGADRSRTIVLQHRLFTVAGGYFAVSPQTDEPSFFVPLGALTHALSIPLICRSFAIGADSDDHRMLALVAKGLRFVRRIRPNDSIPLELLDGTASWTVEEHHQAIARARLAVLLGTHRVQRERPPLDADRLLRMTEDEGLGALAREGERAVAERLGRLGVARPSAGERIDRLAGELAYIESLRERVERLRAIWAGLPALAGAARRDRALVEDIVRVQALLPQALAALDGLLAPVDAALANVVAALVECASTVRLVRARRDDLHHALMAFDAVIAAWDVQAATDPNNAGPLIAETYRAAARYATRAKAS